MVIGVNGQGCGSSEHQRLRGESLGKRLNLGFREKEVRRWEFGLGAFNLIRIRETHFFFFFVRRERKLLEGSFASKRNQTPLDIHQRDFSGGFVRSRCRQPHLIQRWLLSRR